MNQPCRQLGLTPKNGQKRARLAFSPHFWYIFTPDQKLHVAGPNLEALESFGSINDQGVDVFSRAFWLLFWRSFFKNDQKWSFWSFLADLLSEIWKKLCCKALLAPEWPEFR